MSGYHGWLYFKNEQTQERVACPAVAVERQRGRSGPRMALVFKSPVTGEVGEWDELRHGVWASKRVEEARLWAPLSFFVQDPEVRGSVESALADKLAALPAEDSNKNVGPERRARRIRMDDWARGWALDLMWDPFFGLEPNSHAALQNLQAQGDLPRGGEESSFESWLAQSPVIQASAQTPPAAAAPAALSVSDEASPFAAANGASDSAGPSTPALQPVANQPAALAEPAAIAAEGASNEEPASAGPSVAPASDQNPAAAPAPTPSTPEPLASEQGDEDEDEDEEEDELDREARLIFSGDDMLSLAQIAAANKGRRPAFAAPADLSPAPSQTPASPTPAATLEPALEAPAPVAPSAPVAPAPLAFRCARLPIESAPGRPLWHTALFICDSSLKSENFEIVKKHWQGSHASGQKKSGLYSIDALQELHAAGNAISLDGLLASASHTLAGSDGARLLDAETFALHAFHQNPEPAAQAIAVRAKREMVWDRLGSLLARLTPCETPAEFEPVRLCRDPSASGEGMGVWVDAPRGMVKTQQWSDATEDAELVDSYRFSPDERLSDRLRSIVRQAGSLPETDPPAPSGDALYMTPFKAADITSRQDWKANKQKRDASVTPTPANEPARAKMSA